MCKPEGVIFDNIPWPLNWAWPNKSTRLSSFLSGAEGHKAVVLQLLFGFIPVRKIVRIRHLLVSAVGAVLHSILFVRKLHFEKAHISMFVVALNEHAMNSNTGVWSA
jgi:hypothetical protein